MDLAGIERTERLAETRRDEGGLSRPFPCSPWNGQKSWIRIPKSRPREIHCVEKLHLFEKRYQLRNKSATNCLASLYRLNQEQHFVDLFSAFSEHTDTSKTPQRPTNGKQTAPPPSFVAYKNLYRSIFWNIPRTDRPRSCEAARGSRAGNGVYTLHRWHLQNRRLFGLCQIIEDKFTHYHS